MVATASQILLPTAHVVDVLNLLAAGKVPAPVAELLNAGRGVCAPKDEEGNVRPIVVGSVFLRLLGSLGLQLNRGPCDDYFM